MPKHEGYDKVTVDSSGWDAALELSVWDPDDFGKKKVIRIAVEDIPDFLRDVVAQGTRSMATAARRLEVGHCETCGNTGLVDAEKNGRPWSEHCPDCKSRWPSAAFANAPTIGRRGGDDG